MKQEIGEIEARRKLLMESELEAIGFLVESKFINGKFWVKISRDSKESVGICEFYKVGALSSAVQKFPGKRWSFLGTESTEERLAKRKASAKMTRATLSKPQQNNTKNNTSASELPLVQPYDIDKLWKEWLAMSPKDKGYTEKMNLIKKLKGLDPGIAPRPITY